MNDPLEANIADVQAFHLENWTTSSYKLGAFEVIITFGIDPFSEQEPNYHYYITVLQDREKGIYQRKCATLQDACRLINQMYGHWKWVPRDKNEQGGCGDCRAH
jgi:hypothetical protein